MKDLVHKFIARAMARYDYFLVPGRDYNHKVDLPSSFLDMAEFVRPYTQTSIERLYAVYQSVKYIEENAIQGSFVECGVWRGGSSMMAAKAFIQSGIFDRDIFMYDTFEGMPKPDDIDLDHSGKSAVDIWKETPGWCLAGIDEVRKNIISTGYPMERVRFIMGMVENTIPEVVPEKIAILRLDTDFYSSTKHELEHLYPLLSKGGVVIIDDYGHFKGAQQAVDEFLNSMPFKPYLHRVDYTGRVFIKS